MWSARLKDYPRQEVWSYRHNKQALDQIEEPRRAETPSLKICMCHPTFCSFCCFHVAFCLECHSAFCFCRAKSHRALKAFESLKLKSPRNPVAGRTNICSCGWKGRKGQEGKWEETVFLMGQSFSISDGIKRENRIASHPLPGKKKNLYSHLAYANAEPGSDFLD